MSWPCYPGTASTGGGCPAEQIRTRSYGGCDDPAHERHHRADLELQDLAVGSLHNPLGRLAQKGVSPERALDPAHRHCRVEPMTCYVACDEPEIAGRQRERVVPVAADRPTLRGHIPGAASCTPVSAGRRVGCKPRSSKSDAAALISRRRATTAAATHSPAIFNTAMSSSVNGSADSLPTCNTPMMSVPWIQRDAEHHLDPLLPEERVRDGGGVHARQSDGLHAGGDRSGEPVAERDSHALADLLLQPARSARNEIIRARVAQQDRGRVGDECGPDPVQQLGEQVVDVEARQLDIGYCQQMRQTISGVRADHSPRLRGPGCGGVKLRT